MRLHVEPHAFAMLDLESGESTLVVPDGMSQGPDFHERARVVKMRAGTVTARFEQGWSWEPAHPTKS
jgi:hypothetical protein